MSTPASPAKRDAVATRKRLVDGAEREFAQRGYGGARLKTVAAEAGVQITMVHHHFGDKEGLYRAVLERLLTPTASDSFRLLEANPNLESLASGFVKLLTDLYSTHKNLLAILRHEAAEDSGVLTGLLREQMAPIAAGAAALIGEMQHRGEIRTDLTPGEIVALAMSMAAYPFVDEFVLETVLPGGVPKGDGAIARRREAISLVLVRALRP